MEEEALLLKNYFGGRRMSIEANRPSADLNFCICFKFNWRELGFGIVLYKPLYRKVPHKSFWFGVTIRFLWFGLFMKIIDKKPDKENLEYFEKMKLEKELAAFYYKQLTKFKNNSTLDVSWNWYQFGLMLFFKRRNGENNDHFSLLVLWASISFY